MIGTLLMMFVALAVGMFLLFVCISVASCMGVLSLVSPYLLKLLKVSHDKPFLGDQNPINNECFICL